MSKRKRKETKKKKNPPNKPEQPEAPSRELLDRLNQDLKTAATTLSQNEVRLLVDLYYQVQDFRIATANIVRSQPGELNSLADWVFSNFKTIEKDISAAMGEFAAHYKVGRWLQCAPPWSMVRTTLDGDVPISELKDGQQVFAYHRKKSQISGRRRQYGHSIRVSSREYIGDLVSLCAAGQETQATLNHKWPVHIDPDLTCNKYLVYLMRKGTSFRVGRSRLLIRRTGYKNGRLGVIARARIEKADGLWILKTFEKESESAIYENYVAASYGFPTATFEPVRSPNTFLAQDNLMALWSMFDRSVLLERAKTCLIDHDKDIRFPLYSMGTRQAPNNRYLCEVHSINLIPEIMQVPVTTKGSSHTQFTTFEMERRPYSGTVYSLDVAKHHTYIQDGICTCNSLYGIGPNISAGLLAHLDIRVAKTPGNFLSFAGLIDPTRQPWEKKQKRPWNAKLKSLLTVRMGETLIKFSGKEQCVYGHLYVERKKRLIAENAVGKFTNHALERSKDVDKKTIAYQWYSGQYPASLMTKEFFQLELSDRGKLMKTERLKEGEGSPMLPPNHLHSQARRHMAQMLLSHLHYVMYEDYYGKPYEYMPYVHSEHYGDKSPGYDGKKHTHIMMPPGWPNDALGGEPIGKLVNKPKPKKKPKPKDSQE